MVRERPYRLFFPIGLALCAAGLVHWVLYVRGGIGDYRPVFHVVAQVQGFVWCFVAGFLTTMLPRRLQAPPPSLLTLAVVAAAPVAASALTWARAWNAAQLIWCAGAATLLMFVVGRMTHGGRRPPNVFVWLPVGLLLGIGGALVTVLAGRSTAVSDWHQLGQDLVLQGMPLALIAGVGGMVLPLMTRDQPVADGFSSPRDRLVVIAHLAAAVVLLASLWIAVAWSLRVGLALRAAVVMGELLLVAGIGRSPTRTGFNTWVIWAAAWLVPVGLALAAWFPAYPRAGLHVTFVGGYALLALAVASQVSFGHGGRRDVILGRPILVPVVAGLLALSVAARIAMELDRLRYFQWMEVAAVLLLAAVLAWGAWVWPMWSRPRD